jgi:hypothetical protein
VQSLSFELLDWNRLGGDVLIGRVRLPISALAAGRQAHAVLDEDGRPLVAPLPSTY